MDEEPEQVRVTRQRYGFLDTKGCPASVQVLSYLFTTILRKWQRNTDSENHFDASVWFYTPPSDRTIRDLVLVSKKNLAWSLCLR